METPFLISFLLLTSVIRSQVVTSNMFDWLVPGIKTAYSASSGDGGTDILDICNATTRPSKHLCNCSKADKEADCSHMSIEGLPSKLSFPVGIRIIDFQGNLIDAIQYETFHSGPEVTDLVLSNNIIDHLSSQAFQAFANLLRLDISHNRLWSLNKGVLELLGNLRELDLSYNEISYIPSNFFQPVSKLKVLNLESNPFSILDPKQFEYLPNLVSLNMEATMRKCLPDRMFLSLTNLKRLSLANNLMEEIPTVALKVLSKLQNLDLSGNDFEILPSNAFPGMKSLRVLYLDRMPLLTKIDKYAFKGLSRLHELHCSHNFNLREIDEDAFLDNDTGTFLSIDQLFMQQNKLCTLSFHLLPWKEYSEVHLRDNPWHCDCHLLWMLGVRIKNSFQDNVICSSPSHLKGRLLSSMKPEELICGLYPADILLITLGITVALLIILLMVALCVWKRHFSSVSKTYYRVSKHSDSEDVVYEKTTCDSV